LNLLEPKTLLFLQLVPTLMMTGIIWMVQVVQYPLFKFLEAQALVSFHNEYSLRITWVVLPLMVAELALGSLYFYVEANRMSGFLLGSIIFLWGCTFFLSVPLHEQIASGEMGIREKLVSTNWPRTIGWSMRTVALTFLAFQAK